jgi:hypothetical protein
MLIYKYIHLKLTPGDYMPPLLNKSLMLITSLNRASEEAMSNMTRMESDTGSISKLEFLTFNPRVPNPYLPPGKVPPLETKLQDGKSSMFSKTLNKAFTKIQSKINTQVQPYTIVQQKGKNKKQPAPGATGANASAGNPQTQNKEKEGTQTTEPKSTPGTPLSGAQGSLGENPELPAFNSELSYFTKRFIERFLVKDTAEMGKVITQVVEEKNLVWHQADERCSQYFFAARDAFALYFPSNPKPG